LSDSVLHCLYDVHSSRHYYTKKEIVAYFEYVFDIDLGDFYHTYMELKAKTKDRTGFLSTLKDRLLMRMREQD